MSWYGKQTVGFSSKVRGNKGLNPSDHKDNPQDYGLNLLRINIIKINIQDYYRYEQKYNDLKQLKPGEMDGYDKRAMTLAKKRMQECVDFFDSKIGNDISFGNGQLLKTAMINHSVDLKLLKFNKINVKGN